MNYNPLNESTDFFFPKDNDGKIAKIKELKAPAWSLNSNSKHMSKYKKFMLSMHEFNRIMDQLGNHKIPNSVIHKAYEKWLIDSEATISS